MTARCDDVRAMAPELALDALTGAERAAVLEHLDRCESCREEVASLSRVADGVLHLAPPVHPPPGFEDAVLGRIAAGRGADVVPARRWGPWVPSLVAAAVAAVVALAGVLVATGGGADIRTAELVTADGVPVGRLVIFDDDRMVCLFDDTREGSAWTVEVVDGGEVHDVGRFETPGGDWSWTVRLPVDGDAVDEVVVRVGSGQVWATGDL